MKLRCVRRRRAAVACSRCSPTCAADLSGLAPNADGRTPDVARAPAVEHRRHATLLLITSLAVVPGRGGAGGASHVPGSRRPHRLRAVHGVADIADLYTARPDGSDPQHVAADAWDSSWSADGRLIFNQNTGAPGGESYNLFVQDPAGRSNRSPTSPIGMAPRLLARRLADRVRERPRPMTRGGGALHQRRRRLESPAPDADVPRA
jgi:hypothetical protein